ncbi:hypothetical protein X975_05313, partial [Stegodyphus mimosarum]
MLYHYLCYLDSLLMKNRIWFRPLDEVINDNEDIFVAISSSPQRTQHVKGETFKRWLSYIVMLQLACIYLVLSNLHRHHNIVTTFARYALHYSSASALELSPALEAELSSSRNNSRSLHCSEVASCRAAMQFFQNIRDQESLKHNLEGNTGWRPNEFIFKLLSYIFPNDGDIHSCIYHHIARNSIDMSHDEDPVIARTLCRYMERFKIGPLTIFQTLLPKFATNLFLASFLRNGLTFCVLRFPAIPPYMAFNTTVQGLFPVTFVPSQDTNLPGLIIRFIFDALGCSAVQDACGLQYHISNTLDSVSSDSYSVSKQ